MSGARVRALLSTRGPAHELVLRRVRESSARGAALPAAARQTLSHPGRMSESHLNTIVAGRVAMRVGPGILQLNDAAGQSRLLTPGTPARGQIVPPHLGAALQTVIPATGRPQRCRPGTLNT